MLTRMTFAVLQKGKIMINILIGMLAAVVCICIGYSLGKETKDDKSKD